MLDAVAGPMTWYRLVAGKWSAIKKAHLPAEPERALKQRCNRGGAVASVLVIPDGQNVEPSGLYRGLAEVHWLVLEKGTLPAAVGGRTRPMADTLAPELIAKGTLLAGVVRRPYADGRTSRWSYDQSRERPTQK